MNELIIFLFIVLAYLIGSMPTAVWMGQIFFNIDVREHGSGNAGATNTIRVLGKTAGFSVLAIDIFKGWTATMLVPFLMYQGVVDSQYRTFLELIFGVSAVAGHIYPVFANFKGGKGVATLLGMVICIHFEIALICMVVFLLVFTISHYVSLGSMLAALSFPVSMLFPRFHPEENLALVVGFLLFVLVVYTHKANVRRLLKGEESKLYLSKTKN
jgi:glycerol-3-phosphate acyltransferase PlsY